MSIKNFKSQYLILFYFFLFISLNIFSCSSAKKITYFEDIPDSGVVKTFPTAVYTEPKIQVDDILTIIVSTLDLSATQAINVGNIPVGNSNSMSAPSGGVSNQSAGYLVNKDGNVDIPILGEIHVVGLTTVEAKNLIKSKSALFYKDSNVIVRYANFKITVTGEVVRPSTYVMPTEKVTILDALSIAGDLTAFGKRDNILLMRDNVNGTKTAYRINLNKSDILNQPYFYLRQNDYIYVVPSKGRAAESDVQTTRNIAILSSIVTVLVVLISRINF